MTTNDDLNSILSKIEKNLSPQIFNSTEGIPTISFKQDNVLKTFNIKGEQLKDFLNFHLRKEGIRITSYQFDRIVDDFLAQAFDTTKRNVYTRVGFFEETIYLDISDSTYDVVKISPDKWSIESCNNIHFLRPTKAAPLVRPINTDISKFLEKFKKHFQFKNENGWLLLLTAIIKALHRSSAGFVILILEGQKGSGKTSVSEKIKKLIDPCHPTLISPPRDSSDILIMANSSYFMAFDNVSGISADLADTFCRISTGGGVSKRALYSDDSEKIYNIQRPTLINGIDEPSIRPDFLDRCLTLEMNIITDDKRLSKSYLDNEFEKDLPYLLGGIYSLTSQILGILNTIQTQNLPRMTEYSRIGLALESALGLDKNFFLSSYAQIMKIQTENSFWTDELCLKIYEKLTNKILKPKYKFFDSDDSDFESPTIKGTVLKVMQTLYGNSRSSGIGPKSPRGFSSYLKRIEPLLKENGIIVHWLEKRSDGRQITIEFELPPKDNCNPELKDILMKIYDYKQSKQSTSEYSDLNAIDLL